MEACNRSLNEGKIKENIQESKWICYCVSHRFTLFVLALIKLALSLGLLVILCMLLSQCNFYGSPILLYHIIIWIAITIDMVDIVIGLIIIKGVFKKNLRIMKMYYIYSICVFGSLTFLCCVIFYIMSESLVTFLIIIFIFFLVVVLQEYLNHMLKWEVHYLTSDQCQL